MFQNNNFSLVFQYIINVLNLIYKIYFVHAQVVESTSIFTIDYRKTLTYIIGAHDKITINGTKELLYYNICHI